MELSFIELEKTVMRKFRVKIRIGFWTFGLRYLLDIQVEMLNRQLGHASGV